MTDPVVGHQRLAAGLATRIRSQLAINRRQLRVERVDHPQPDRDLLARGFRQRRLLEPGAALRGQQYQAGASDPVVLEDRVDALLPLAAIIDQRVPQPHTGAEIEQMLRRDPALRQLADHQQLA